tara:strand:+ start:94 stop:345 length:252 start_codon:yes stop_codon:yes gene_type:complete
MIYEGDVVVDVDGEMGATKIRGKSLSQFVDSLLDTLDKNPTAELWSVRRISKNGSFNETRKIIEIIRSQRGSKFVRRINKVYG